VATPSGIEQIDQFFDTIAPWAQAYRGKTFHYFGLASDTGIQICAARIRLQAQQAGKERVFRFGRYVAGAVPLVGDMEHVRNVTGRIAAGEAIEIRTGLKIELPRDDHAGLYVQPPRLLHPEGLSTGRRLGILTIQAGNSPIPWDRVQVDWTLKSAPEPYDGVGELLVDLGLGGQVPGRCTLEVVSTTVVEVAAKSRIDGEQAHIGVWLPARLSPRKAGLRYRVLVGGSPTQRGSLSPRKLEWIRDGDARIGMASMRVARGAVMNCIATYGGAAHHSYWLADPRQIANPRTLALSTIDESLDVLNSILTQTPLRGSAAPQFEWAVAAALWASGLAPAQTGYADQTKDGPDILAVSPSGDLLVVECTLGLLKAENKLAKLIRRTVVLREKLTNGLPASPTVLPVIVTRLPRREVESELETATDAGVLVLTRESLESAKHEMLLFPDGDAAFRRGLDALERERAELEERRRQERQRPGGIPDVPVLGNP
jgi:hypothetical protein